MTAERPGFQPAHQTVTWTDQSPSYMLRLSPMKKDLSISTDPPGAQVFVDSEPLGTSPVRDVGRAFAFDVQRNEFVPHEVRVEKPGYDPVTVNINWDEGKTDYDINLLPKSKTVRIVTDPPNAAVSIDGKEAKRDELGETVAQLSFPPTNEKGGIRRK